MAVMDAECYGTVSGAAEARLLRLVRILGTKGFCSTETGRRTASGNERKSKGSHAKQPADD